MVKCKFKKGDKVTLKYQPWEGEDYFDMKTGRKIDPPFNIHATIKDSKIYKKGEIEGDAGCYYSVNIGKKSIKCFDHIDQQDLSMPGGLYSQKIIKKRTKKEFCD